MNAIAAITQKLQALNIQTKEILASNPLVATTEENWKIYFNPTSDINLQITKMNLLLTQELPAEKRGGLQYIYLQYKDKAYYQ